MFQPTMRRIVYDFLNKNKGIMTMTMLSSVAVFFSESVILPRILGKTFANIDNPEQLRTSMIQLLISWVVIQGCYTVNDFFNSRIEPLLTRELSNQFFQRIWQKYENEHQSIDPAELLDKILVLQNMLESVIYRTFVSILPRIINIIVILINVWSLNAKFGYYCVGMVLLICVAVAALITSMPSNVDAQEHREEYVGKLTDVLHNMDTISATPGGIEMEMEKYHEMTHKSMDFSLRSKRHVIGLQSFIYAGNVVLFAFLLYTLYIMHVRQEISGNEVSTLILCISPLFTTVSDLMYYVPEFNRYLSVLGFHEPFMSELYSHAAHTGASPHMESGAISLTNISFQYRADQAFVLPSCSLEIPSGAFVTLRGPSGSGKSTFIQLLYRILKPTTGTIQLGGHAIDDLSSTAIKQHITYLNQHASLFDATIYENIIYGHKDTPKLKKQVLSMFDTYKMRDVFDDGDFLSKPVGKDAENVSGGQRQTILLMRCMLNSAAKILILDEPTSAVDAAHTTNVMNMLFDLNRQGKTILLISHQLQSDALDELTFDYGMCPVWNPRKSVAPSPPVASRSKPHKKSHHVQIL